jgi:hypothetical protein
VPKSGKPDFGCLSISETKEKGAVQTAPFFYFLEEDGLPDQVRQ